MHTEYPITCVGDDGGPVARWPTDRTSTFEGPQTTGRVRSIYLGNASNVRPFWRAPKFGFFPVRSWRSSTALLSVTVLLTQAQPGPIDVISWWSSVDGFRREAIRGASTSPRPRLPDTQATYIHHTATAGARWLLPPLAVLLTAKYVSGQHAISHSPKDVVTHTRIRATKALSLTMPRTT